MISTSFFKAKSNPERKQFLMRPQNVLSSKQIQIQQEKRLTRGQADEDAERISARKDREEIALCATKSATTAKRSGKSSDEDEERRKQAEDETRRYPSRK
jgi:hypothetical protein